MSIKLMAQVWDSPYKGSELLILLVLADHANDQGVCWPSYKTIAQKAKISKRHVIRLIRKFEDDGLITIRRARIEDTQNTANVYRLNAEMLDEPPMGGGSDTMSLGGDIAMSGGSDTSVTRGSDIAMSPKPPIEPSSSNGDDDEADKSADPTQPDPVTVAIRESLHSAGVLVNQTVLELYRAFVVDDKIAIEVIQDAITEAVKYGKQHNFNYVRKIILSKASGDTGKPDQVQSVLDFSLGDLK